MAKSRKNKKKSTVSVKILPIDGTNNHLSCSEKYLHPVVTIKSMLQTMYAKKRDNYIYQKVHSERHVIFYTLYKREIRRR